MKRIVIDLDETLTLGKGADYLSSPPNEAMIQKLREYKSNGFTIAIHTSRNMNSYNNNNGLIVANTVPVIIKWLESNNVPYDEIWPGKPWCGLEGFYVDDKTIRPQEFLNLTLSEIDVLLNRGARK